MNTQEMYDYWCSSLDFHPEYRAWMGKDSSVGHFLSHQLEIEK